MKMIAYTLTLAALLLSTALSARDFEVGPKDSAGLVQAFIEADAHPGPDRILLAYRGTYVLTQAHSELLALPPISDELKVLGRGSEIRLYSPQPLGLLRVAPSGSLELFDLVIAGSSHTAMINQGRSSLTQVRFEDNFSRHLAGAIDNQGVLDLRDCAISFNTAQARSVVGGVFNSGTLTASHLTMSSNLAQSKSSSARVAAAIFNQGEMRIEFAKLDLNEVIGANSSVFINGARGRLTINNSAIESLETPAFAAQPGDQPIQLNDTSVSAGVVSPIAQY